jgi:DedD protein
MAFFNFRRDGSNAASSAASASQPETAEVVRRRAKHRLIGSAVLVLAGVIGFPLLFDTQPRPVAVDIPIEIPGKNAVKPLVIAKPPASTPSKASPEKVAPDASLSAAEEILPLKQAAAQAAPAPVAIKNEAKPDPQPDARAPVKAPEKAPEKVADKPVSKPEPKAVVKPPTAAAEGRMVVQVGAFSDTDKARDARAKLEKAGLKTYTQVAETKDGKRIRVRVGPFASRADAEKAASKIKTLDLPAAILTL